MSYILILAFVLINHPYQKINAPLKFNILLHKLLPSLFIPPLRLFLLIAALRHLLNPHPRPSTRLRQYRMYKPDHPTRRRAALGQIDRRAPCRLQRAGIVAR